MNIIRLGDHSNEPKTLTIILKAMAEKLNQVPEALVINLEFHKLMPQILSSGPSIGERF